MGATTRGVDPAALRLAQQLDETNQHVIAVDWDTYSRWHAAVWRPGQHVALIGPTGEGKSTHAVHILKPRKYVLALDAKGGDEILSKAGYEPVYDMPLTNKHWERIAKGLPLRLMPTGSTRTDADLAKLVALMRKSVNTVRMTGGFTLYADEFQLLADRRMYGIDKEIEALHIAARSDGASVLTSFQAMAWVPKSATRQASIATMWPTRDEDMVKAVARAMGRRWQNVVAAVKEIPQFHSLTLTKNVHAPMIITKAPKLD